MQRIQESLQDNGCSGSVIMYTAFGGKSRRLDGTPRFPGCVHRQTDIRPQGRTERIRLIRDGVFLAIKRTCIADYDGPDAVCLHDRGYPIDGTRVVRYCFFREREARCIVRDRDADALRAIIDAEIPHWDSMTYKVSCIKYGDKKRHTERNLDVLKVSGLKGSSRTIFVESPASFRSRSRFSTYSPL